MPQPTVDQQLEQLIAIYTQAEAALELLIAKAIKSGAAGTLRYRRKVQQQVQAILGQLERRGMPRAERLVKDSYGHGARLVRGPVPVFGQPDIQAVNLLSENLTSRLKDSHVIVGRRVDDVFRREGIKAVASRMAQAGQTKMAAKQLVTALEEQGVKSFTDKAGRNWSLSNYANMAVRTTARQAATQGTVNKMLQMGFDLVDVSSHPHKSDACTPYDGKTFSLSGKDNEFPHIKVLPPFHPNCRHVLKPSKENYKRAAAKLDAA